MGVVKINDCHGEVSIRQQRQDGPNRYKPKNGKQGHKTRAAVFGAFAISHGIADADFQC